MAPAGEILQVFLIDQPDRLDKLAFLHDSIPDFRTMRKKCNGNYVFCSNKFTGCHGQEPAIFNTTSYEGFFYRNHDPVCTHYADTCTANATCSMYTTNR